MATHPRRRRERRQAGLTPDPGWYRTAIIYEIAVRAFCDSNEDGVGDLPGLTSKLDYLADLGVTALWLLPFYPSPLRDGGYDIADYTSIHPVHGTIDDFKRLLDEAHARDIRIITELVINHTSSDHAWFQRARRAPPGSVERDFYVWSDTQDRYADARIIFRDFERSNWTWDHDVKAYYWHRFYSHQPDLNFDNLAVHDAVVAVMDFWLDLGVDGLRLDAVPYLYERDDTICENLPETHAFLKKLRAHVDARYRDRMLLAEANQWPVDAAAYFGDGDECHMNFHFPLMPRMFMAVQMEDRFPILDILRQTPALPPGCQWATFLRNHDELTLEMVTDEERDYMYQVFTEDAVARINLGIRRRLAPLLRSRRKIELINALLFSLPGTPVLYYGDEIGMGDNIYLGDRDGVRTPMQWSADRNAGFSRANPQRLHLPIIIDPEYHYEAINVEAQQQNPTSLLRWMKRLIALRKQHEALGSGDLEFITTDNPKVLVFVRRAGDDRIVVAANLSRFPQHAHANLEAFTGMTPVEIFGSTPFPPISERPYPLAFGPHAFYWFSVAYPNAVAAEIPTLRLTDERWTQLLDDRETLAEALAAFVVPRRWFRGKARLRTGAHIADVVPLGNIQLVSLVMQYGDAAAETYLVPLAFAVGAQARAIEGNALVAHVDIAGDPSERGALYDALGTGEAARVLLDGMLAGGEAQGETGRLVFQPAPLLRELCGDRPPSPTPTSLEQSNTTVPFGDRLIMKVFRQLEQGESAEVELGEFLTEHAPAGLVPRLAGTVAWAEPRGEPGSVAVAHEFVPNEGVAWDFFAERLERLLEAAVSTSADAPPVAAGDVFDLAVAEPPAELCEVAGHDLRRARRLGERVADVHATLAAGGGPAFAPEPFTAMYQQSLYQGARSLLARSCEGLAVRRATLPAELQDPVAGLIAAQPAIDARLRRITETLIDAIRVRAHGDLHLGQVLFTGDDFVVIDFEGEPGRPLRERRYKRCVLRDVAGMLRSFSYVAEYALRGRNLPPQDAGRVRPWARLWTAWTGAAFVAGYLERARDPALVPLDEQVRRRLIDFYLVEKCIYEVNYELNNRPAWLPIPIDWLLGFVGAQR